MEYLAYVTYQSDKSWRAIIPDLPDCAVNAETRSEALAKVRLLALEFMQHTEQVRIELPPPSIPSNEAETALELETLGYGAFKDDPTWGELFDEIERQRDENLLGDF